jgi:ribosomal protein L37AE/L43A
MTGERFQVGHQTYVPDDDEPEPDVCPYCGRVMSRREAAEQGACNDCYGGAY